MPLSSLPNALNRAREGGYAVGAFNIISLDGLHAIADAAVEAQSPVIFAVAEIHFPYFRFEFMAHVARKVAESLPVPVMLHLDHGYTFPTMIKALQCGFSSVMFDGSPLPFDENIAQTRQVVGPAHAVGVHVEAELGSIGGTEGTIPEREVLLTDVGAAVEFVERTQCDALAVAIGTSHGVYKGKPNLDFARLEEIRSKVRVPLVLHGGTGLSDDDIRRCIQGGISKVNVYTQLNLWATETARARLARQPDFINWPELLVETQGTMKSGIIRCMELFGSAGKASGG